MAHKLFIAFLFLLAVTAAMAVGINGMEYYSRPENERVFNPEHRLLKPSGAFGHGYGIAGAAMIIAGVVLYSSRKRFRVLWNAGKLSDWLDVHIFLCLLGPVLVLYHTTFKASGIAAICLWTMLSVVASGLIGRFLYILIPRNVKGNELTAAQINQQFDAQRKALLETDSGSELIEFIDRNFSGIKRPAGISGTIALYFQLGKTKRRVKSLVRKRIREKDLSHRSSRAITRMVGARATLIQRSILLLQVEKMFYYWHAIHLPFTAIMFLTLAAHIGVALWLGYHWIF